MKKSESIFRGLKIMKQIIYILVQHLAIFQTTHRWKRRLLLWHRPLTAHFCIKTMDRMGIEELIKRIHNVLMDQLQAHTMGMEQVFLWVNWMQNSITLWEWLLKILFLALKNPNLFKDKEALTDRVWISLVIINQIKMIAWWWPVSTLRLTKYLCLK